MSHELQEHDAVAEASLTCRCGWKGQGEHPCHGNGYTCRKPAQQRFYVPTMKFSLAGNQLKFSTAETWACDECWENFKKLMKEVRDA